MAQASQLPLLKEFEEFSRFHEGSDFLRTCILDDHLDRLNILGLRAPRRTSGRLNPTGDAPRRAADRAARMVFDRTRGGLSRRRNHNRAYEGECLAHSRELHIDWLLPTFNARRTPRSAAARRAPAAALLALSCRA